jgi:hypothetical protein
MDVHELLEETRRLTNECRAVGLPSATLVFNSDLTLCGEPHELFKLVRAAHGTALDSAETLALRDRLGAESAEWLAYVTARNEQIQCRRRAAYAERTDSLLADALGDAEAIEDPETGCYAIRIPKTKWDSWHAARREIQEELPYPT